ncbi:hypothetical protein HanRHA438_Chr05g0239931 [Helianthus annuus]|nr:hypothetical protein HanRHA438_Chr05g0239931 [Helianthus annuus]
MELKWVFKWELSILIVSWKHTLRVLAKGAEHPNSHSHTRARGGGDEAQCGALMAHFALRPLESCLFIFDHVRVVNHRGCKDQVVVVACGFEARDMAVRAQVHEGARLRMVHGSCCGVRSAPE